MKVFAIHLQIYTCALVSVHDLTSCFLFLSICWTFFLLQHWGGWVLSLEVSAGNLGVEICWCMVYPRNGRFRWSWASLVSRNCCGLNCNIWHPYWHDWLFLVLVGCKPLWPTSCNHVMVYISIAAVSLTSLATLIIHMCICYICICLSISMRVDLYKFYAYMSPTHAWHYPSNHSFVCLVVSLFSCVI